MSDRGIPGIVIGGFILAFFCPLIGLILCAVGLPEAQRRNSGVGLAYAGIIIGILLMLTSAGYYIGVGV